MTFLGNTKHHVLEKKYKANPYFCLAVWDWWMKMAWSALSHQETEGQVDFIILHPCIVGNVLFFSSSLIISFCCWQSSSCTWTFSVIVFVLSHNIKTTDGWSEWHWLSGYSCTWWVGHTWQQANIFAVCARILVTLKRMEARWLDQNITAGLLRWSQSAAVGTCPKCQVSQGACWYTTTPQTPPTSNHWRPASQTVGEAEAQFEREEFKQDEITTYGWLVSIEIFAVKLCVILLFKNIKISHIGGCLPCPW